MKHSSSRRCWCSRCCSCCCWLIMLFVASSVVNVSPEIATTTTTTIATKSNKNSPAALSLTSVTKDDFYENAKGVASAKSTTTMTTILPATTINPVAAKMMTIMMELSTATVASQITTISPQIATNMNKRTTTNSAAASAANMLPQRPTQTTSLARTTQAAATPTGTLSLSSSSSTSFAPLSRTLTVAPHHNSPVILSHSPHRQNHLISQQPVPLPLTSPPIHFEQPLTPEESNGRRRSTRQADAGGGEQADKCRLFVEGEAESEKNELYSPDYPNDYPKNINCTRVITAPKGQIIRLDFRNSFHIEAKEECKFDFLEIRDGQYGFSTLIGKYCGTDFPPEITSKERYLWLHFHSDESIEYSGFTAVYEFIDRNREAPSTDLNCTIITSEPEGWVNSSDIPQEIKDTVNRNKVPLDCMWRIQVQEKWKILVKFYEFKLNKPNDCETNFLDIFPEETVMPLRMKNFCGSAGEGITSESNILHIRFFAEQTAAASNFAILYTAFRDRGSGACADDEYDCEDATCISNTLFCNGNDNCKFRWDEEGCDKDGEKQSDHVTIIIIVFGLILGGMVITFLINCVRKIMRDQKIIREHIRQSKESKLDEMGRQSKSRDNISVAMSPRQKHSQTSLQILDDVSNRYYREVIPVAVQTSTTKADLKEKEHSILRHHHDMTVQTSLCGGDDDNNDNGSSTTTTATDKNGGGGGVGGGGNMACDMGCQTRESLFGSAVMRQKSKTPSIGGAGGGGGVGMPMPPRFSTFGYEMQQVPPLPSGISRHSIRIPQGSAELEEQRHSRNIAQQQQALQQPQHGAAPIVGASRQPEICHHHHQHQQHLQQQQKAGASQTLPQRSHYAHQHAPQQQQHQQQQQQQQHYQSKAHIPPLMSGAPPSANTMKSGGGSGGGGPVPPSAPSGGKSKPQKVDESKVFIDIRNSAPDVIIMTSH